MVGILAFAGAIVASYLGAAAAARADGHARIEARQSDIYARFAGLAAEQLTVLDELNEARATQNDAAIPGVVRRFSERQSKMRAALVDLELFASPQSYQQGQRMLTTFDDTRTVLLQMTTPASTAPSADIKVLTGQVVTAADRCRTGLDDFALVVKKDLGLS